MPKARGGKATPTKTAGARRVTSVKKKAGKKAPVKKVTKKVKAKALQPISRDMARHKVTLGSAIARVRDRTKCAQMSQEGKEVTEAVYWNLLNNIAVQLPKVLTKNTKTINVKHARGAVAMYATSSGSDGFGDDLVRAGNDAIRQFESNASGDGQKRARSARAGTCIQPYRVERIIRKNLPKGIRLGHGVPEFLAAVADELVLSIVKDAREVAGGDKKQVGAVHIARVLKDSEKPYHGIVPPVANVHALDPVEQRESQAYVELIKAKRAEAEDEDEEEEMDVASD